MADSNNALIDGAYVLTILSSFIIFLRVVLRRLKHEKFMGDDYLMVWAGVWLVLYTVGFVVAVKHDINLDQKDPGHLKQNDIDSVTLGSKWILAGRPFLMSYLWLLKGCMLIYFTRLDLDSLEELLVKGTGGFLFLTWFGCMLAFFLECRPVHLYWQVVPNAPICSEAIGATIMLGASDITTNLILMSIPALLILREPLPLKRNLQIGSLYLITLFVIASSVIRMALVLSNIPAQHRVLWGEVECFAATILVNAPVIHRAWRHSYSHARRGRFGRNQCPPEYTLAVRTATESEAEIHDESPSRAASLGAGMRKSIAKLGEKMRRSLEVIQIQTSVELLQENKPGRMDHETETGGQDLFLGAGHGPVAQIHTHVHTGFQGNGERSQGGS